MHTLRNVMEALWDVTESYGSVADRYVTLQER